MANLIRVKQLDQSDLSGFFNTAFINTGILHATFVDKFTDENISGIKTFVGGVNLNNIDNLSLSGVDITITSGNVTLTNPVSAPNLVNITYNTGDQTISGVKNFNDGLNISNNPLFYSQPSGYLTGIGYSGNYDGGYFLGTTKLSQKTSRLVDSNFGSVWTAKQSSRVWRGISISSDGKYQTATVYGGQIYTSSDYGNTWATKDINRLWWNVSISSNGKYQTATVYGGQIYISKDYGNTWAPTGPSIAWTSVSISSDGKYQSAIVSGGGIYISNDYGNTWTRKNTNTFNWNSISISNDGKYQSATVQNSNIYISNDYGDTWAAKATSKIWQNISISADGKYQTAVGAGSEIYVSADYGNTWAIKDSIRPNWSSISISSDGKYQTALAGNDGVYVSTDYGNTWTLKRSGIGICYYVSISSDGKYQSLVSYNGQIYISKTDELIDGNLYADNLIYNTGDQTISGVKTFVSGVIAQNLSLNDLVGGNSGVTFKLNDGDLQVSNKSGVIFGLNYLSALPFTGLNSIILTSNNTTIKLPPNKNDFIAMSSEVVYKTGNQTISGIKTFANSGVFSLSSAIPLSLPNNPLSIVGSGNSYLQLNIQNIATGSIASSDLVITANNGTDTANYINLGINNSGYNDPTFSNGNANDGYLFINGGSLDIGTQTTGTNIEFHIGGTTAIRTIARLTSDGLNIVSGTLTASNVVYNTGDQNISGTKNFYIRPTVNGSGIRLFDEPITATLPNTVVYTTGDQNIFGVKTFFNSGVFSLSGVLPLSLPSNPLSIVGSGNTYLQLNIQNRATGNTASADLVITANNGTDAANFINLGINNIGYSDPTFNNATGLDGYLIMDGGDLDIGTRTPGKIIEFHAGGTTEANVIAKISESGLNLVSGNLTVGGTGVLLSGQNSFVLPFISNQTNTNAGLNYFGSFTLGYSTVPSDRSYPLLENCVARKITFTLHPGTVGTNIPAATGHFINTTTSTTGSIFLNAIPSAIANNLYHYNGNINVPINTGHNIVCALQTSAVVANTRCLAQVYAYN
jgi:photosystem II stability/assembly factor-like uncharacterized protein